ncbi:hypothetical protein OQA88_1445 [Cercophora sp. LCS_1]
MSWNKLPAELRLMVFRELAFLRDPVRPEERYDFVNYARVCKQWHARWTAESFHQIVLDQDRISDLDELTKKSPSLNRLIRQIYLRIKLPNYDCSVCQQEDDLEAKGRNNTVFTKAVVGLFTVISTWPQMIPKPHVPVSRALSLEISAYSPSDYQHGFKDFRLKNDYPICFDTDVYIGEGNGFAAEKQFLKMTKQEQHDDPVHGWANGTQSPVCLGTRKRLTETLSLDQGVQIPRARAVTTLIVRRQSYRPIETSSLRQMLRAVPKLALFTHEPWYNVTPELQMSFEREYRKLLNDMQKTNKKLQNIILFQNASKLLNPDVPDNGNGSSPSPKGKRLLGNHLARASRKLDTEVLSAAFLVDAYDFFHEFTARIPRECRDLLIWSNLREVNLTSRHLHDSEPLHMRQGMLCRAGHAAALMPNLEVLTLWNGGRGFSYIMQYLRFTSRTQGSLLALASTSDSVLNSDFSPEVLAVWQLVPRTLPEPNLAELQVVRHKHKKPKESFQSAYSTVWYLRWFQIAHDISIREMITEEKFRPREG